MDTLTIIVSIYATGLFVTPIVMGLLHKKESIFQEDIIIYSFCWPMFSIIFLPKALFKIGLWLKSQVEEIRYKYTDIEE